MRDLRNLLQMQVLRFTDQQLIQPSVFPQNERIVHTRHQQYVLHPIRHQVVEAFELHLYIGKRYRKGLLLHENAPLQTKTAGWLRTTPPAL